MFNRIFKNEFNKKGEIDFITYAHTLIIIAKEQKDFFENELKIIPIKANDKDINDKININKHEEQSSDKELQRLLEVYEQSGEKKIIVLNHHLITKK